MEKSLKVESRRGFEAHLADSKFYQKILEKIPERFGKSSRVYETLMTELTRRTGGGSQLFFRLEANRYTAEGQRVATFKDMERINDADPSFLEGIYTETPELILRTEKPYCAENKRILENLVAQVKERGLEFSPEEPLILSGLEIISDHNNDNPYGIFFYIGDQTVATHDSRFAYDKCLIKLGKQTRVLQTQKGGISKISVNRGKVIGSNSGDFLRSPADSQIILFEDKEAA